jgi:hypothetical protein
VTFLAPIAHILSSLPPTTPLSFRYKDDDNKLVQRSYTPTTADETPGTVEFVVKIYHKDMHEKVSAASVLVLI